MNFKEFFEMIRPVIGGKGGDHKFARTLFDAIITEEGADVLDDYSENTYKAYARKEVQSRTSFCKKRGDRYLISGHFGDVYA